MSVLKLYNSMGREVQDFTPLYPGKVRMYNCGPTVYKRQHIGNMRRFLAADFLRRTLELFGYEVKDVTNITDVGHLTDDDIDAGEDKLEKAARETAVMPQQIAEEQTHLFMADLHALNILPAHKYPRATKHIEGMQKLIGTLLEKGLAYKTESGIYFDVTTFPAYGQLSGNTLAGLEAGARVEVRGDKKHAADFALWIFNDKQVQLWDSPWGFGYPGWHIECSAMALEYLGHNIDIHTGGEDNIFPHHENEIAQAEGATGEKLARFWLHNRHLQIDGKKMAKREGESITIDTFMEKSISPLAFRLMVFAAHYRVKMDFSWEGLDIFVAHLASLKQTLRVMKELGATADGGQADAAVMAEFMAALADDVNTPQAWALYLGYLKDTNANLNNKEEAQTRLATLLAMDKVIGVAEVLWDDLRHEEVPEHVMKLVAKRDELKAAKKYEEADAARIEIERAGYKVEDTSHGTRVIKIN